MPVFVTGGTGFLGLNLVRLLVERGHRVRVLVRSNAARLGLDSELIEFVHGDVTDAASVRRAMDGCDRVYHLAGWVQISPWGAATAHQVNVVGTANVCSAALETGVARLVHTSSIATIAAGTLNNPADEGTAWNLRAEGIPYYQSKIGAERVVLDHVKRGLDAVIVNPTYVVGPWDVKPSAGRMLIQTATRRLRVYPARGGINFADVRQVAAGHIQAMDKAQAGERYILGGKNLSFESYFSRVAGLAGVPAPRIGPPYWAMYPFAAAGSLLGRLMPKTFRDLNLCVLTSAFLEHYVSSAKAVRQLGFDATPIDKAIEDALRWFVDYGYMSRVSGSYRRGAGRITGPVAG